MSILQNENFGSETKMLSRSCFNKADKIVTESDSDLSSEEFVNEPISTKEYLIPIAMMVGAGIWFVVGYIAGDIYIYPPILFTLGLIRLIKIRLTR